MHIGHSVAAKGINFRQAGIVFHGRVKVFHGEEIYKHIVVAAVAFTGIVFHGE